ncbi:tryptophan synthase, alpha subunit [Vulcanisaeta moutnovskia 768-28]|uniref:tryptophan synthase n=1 Tax=Vulcanisaeta moutnovskia (strain 768-28) TaxID=985053 RepID=F0QT38_VULM7|nr:tryptophan synthase subunit alpha [Vulcanisaeta moutnovskia]ADY01627.1 tryptophan synthase, alpha subunit [Vulcanisaeta moutnovskia 768-28]
MDIRKPGLGAYITATYPNKETFLNAVKCLSGVSDFLEIGIPTQNPKYDGPVIRKTHFGSELKGLDAIRVTKYGDVPTILMGYIDDYVNNLGLVTETASEVGASSVLFPDLLFEHLDMLENYINAMREYSLRPTFFISSNTPYTLVGTLIKYEPLFIYLGLYAATGIKLPLYIERNVREVRKLVDNITLIAGFAINTPEMVKLVISAGADAVVVGTALVDKLNDQRACVEFMTRLRGGLP